MATNNTKQAAWIGIGSLFSFGFAIVSSMILSRYFDKGDYGTYKQVLYIYNSLLTIFTLGLPKAYSYFLPRSPFDEAKSVISKLTKLFFILGGGLSLLLFLFSGKISEFFVNPDLEYALKIFSPVPFLMMPTMGLESILVTYKKTSIVAIYTFATRFMMLCCVALPVMLFGLGYIEAIIGFVVASFLSFIIALYLKYYPVKNAGNIKTPVSYKQIFYFSIPLCLASIWGTLINLTDQFFISRYFGNDVFAEFSNGAMELPFVGMIIGASSSILTPLFTRKVYENANFKTDIWPIWNSAFSKSAKLIYPVVFICFFDASLIMSVMYGDMYEASGNFFQIKLMTYFVKIIAFYSILVALGATKFYSNVLMYGFLLLLPLEYIAVKLLNNPLVVTAVHVLFTISYCLVFLKYITKKFNVPFMSIFPLKDIFKIILCSLLSLSVVAYCKYELYPELDKVLILMSDFVIFGIIFLFISIPFNLNYLNIIKPLLKK